MMINVRFFIYDYEAEEVDIKEVDEFEFIQAKGCITYERNTIFENGGSQICLTKDENNDSHQ
jgi:hypothetical protein